MVMFSESQNGTWRAELFVKLLPVVYDGVSKNEKRAGDVGATSNHQQEPSDSKKKLEKENNPQFVKSQNFSNLKNFTSWDRKFLQPPIFGKRKPKEPEAIAQSQSNL